MSIGGIAVGAASNLTSTAIIELVTYLKNFVESDDNLQFLISDLTRMEGILRDIRNQFEDQQKTLPPLLQNSLESMKNALQEVKNLIHRAERQRQRCLGCCLLCNPKLPAQIREWKTIRFNQLFQELDSALSRAAHTALIVESAHPQRDVLPQTEVLLQPVPDSGFVGSGIQAAQAKLQIWLNNPDPQARVIGLYGMAGVGKTSLLQLVHNDCKKKVSTNFDFVIWFTVSQNLNIENLHDTIAESVSLDLNGISSFDTRKMKLYACLENKRFLLILDDVWSPIADLEQVGINFGHDNTSRVLICSRYKYVVETMAPDEYCMMMKPLSTEEGWELFRRKAFRNGTAPDNTVEATARDIAEECRGLPLAINTVAAAVARKKSADEWRRALVLMRNVDPSFPSTHPTIHAELYQRLRWSYNDLPSYNLKMCFLYCAAFPEDAEIYVERLVEMWTAESLVPQKGKTYHIDIGREYIDALVDRCLIQYVEEEDVMDKKAYIRVHDVLRDMAIYVGEGEEKCLFLSSQHLQHFPDEEDSRDRKRISLFDNQISHLPTDLKCRTLVSLVLAKNRQLKEIPERFLGNFFMSLKVLDLSYTSIEALPASVGQLEQLQCLHLRWCEELKELPDSICDLSHLQFLNLQSCDRLNFLPDRIGQVKNLKHLNLEGVGSEGLELLVNPHQICQLTSLNKLVLPRWSTPMSLEDLTNLSYLIELDVTVKPDIKGSSMSSWSEMRELSLSFSEDDVEDDAALDILFQNMQSMKKLQYLRLDDYQGESLPNCISNFQNFKRLYLVDCTKLKELPGLEIGSDGFPMLEILEVSNSENLESIVWNEKTMLKLQNLDISRCPVLKTFRTEELPNLREVRIDQCDELIDVSQIGCLPRLEGLTLRRLKKLESIAHWNEKTMPNLQNLHIISCPLLKRLPMGMDKLANLREIEGDLDWWKGIIWENNNVKNKISQFFKESI